MRLPLTAMGVGRSWLNSLFGLETYLDIQLFASIFVLVGCILQLDIDRKFRWPPEPGRITVFGFWLGIKLHSPRLSLFLGDAGRYGDFMMTVVGRLGVAGQGAAAVFAIDDSLSRPNEPRTMLTWALVCIVMIQARALTAYTPRKPRRPEEMV